MSQIATDEFGADPARSESSDCSQADRLMYDAPLPPHKNPANSCSFCPEPISSARIWPFHSMLTAEPSLNYDPGAMDADNGTVASLACRVRPGEIWRRCNMNNNGLLDEAFSSLF